MKRNLLVWIIMLGLVGYVSATGNITGIVCDYNTMNRLANTTVNLYLGGSLDSANLTNINGEFTFLNKNANNYSITFTKVDYVGETQNLELVDGTTENLLVKLKPMDYQAIIRITFNDLGMGMNDACIYYSTGRLKGCYEMNDTIILQEHQDYHVVLRPKEIDIIGNPVQSGITIMNYSGNILRFVFVVVIVGIIAILFVKVLGR